MLKRLMLTLVLFLSITGATLAADVITTDKGYPIIGNGSVDLIQTAQMAKGNEFKFQIQLTKLGGNAPPAVVWQLFSGTEIAPGQFRVLMTTPGNSSYTLRGVSVVTATGAVDTIGPSCNIVFP